MIQKVPISADKLEEDSLSVQQKVVFKYVKENGKITSHQVEELFHVMQRRARAILGETTKKRTDTILSILLKFNQPLKSLDFPLLLMNHILTKISVK